MNTRLTIIGGRWTSEIDSEQSSIEYKTAYDMSNPYSKQRPHFVNLDLTITYRKNKPKYSSLWMIQIKNLMAKRPNLGNYYSVDEQAIKERKGVGIFPILSYKIEF